MSDVRSEGPHYSDFVTICSMQFAAGTYPSPSPAKIWPKRSILPTVRSEFGTSSFNGYTDLIGFDLRRGLRGRWDVGVNTSIYHSYQSKVIDYGAGLDVGFNLATNMWLALGYNFVGFHDEDFSQARYTAQGPYLRFSIKADQRTLKDIAGQR